MKKIITSLLAILVIGTTTTSAFAETVMLNTNTHIYHKPSCKWAKKCTVNCVPNVIILNVNVKRKIRNNK